MRKTSKIKIGKNLKKLRNINGYTQEQLAEKIEVSVRYLSDIEQDRSKPSYEVLIRICNVFNVSIDEIFSEYLNVKAHKRTDYFISGYENLNNEDKKTIQQLIFYFNEKTKK